MSFICYSQLKKYIVLMWKGVIFIFTLGVPIGLGFNHWLFSIRLEVQPAFPPLGVLRVAQSARGLLCHHLNALLFPIYQTFIHGISQYCTIYYYFAHHSVLLLVWSNVTFHRIHLRFIFLLFM